MKRGPVAIALLLAACSKPQAPPQKAPSLIDSIEAKVVMPQGAEPLKAYTRYYAFDTRGGVAGVYLLGRPSEAGQRWMRNMRDLPFVADGGCGVVELKFNPATDKIEDIFCHGEA